MSFFSHYFHSPDSSGNPLERKAYFFLARKSDDRSSFLAKEKKTFQKEIETNSRK